MAEPLFRAETERMVDEHPPGLEDLREDYKAKVKTERKGLHPLLIVAPAAAQAVDAYSTQQGLRRGGTREGNRFMEPFADNPAAMYATKAGAGLLAGFLADRLARSGHKTLGKIVAGIEVAVPLGVATSNATKGRR